MISGEKEIRHVIVVSSNAIPSCGACQEIVTQLTPDTYRSIDIMMDCDNHKHVKFGELTPEWWIK